MFLSLDRLLFFFFLGFVGFQVSLGPPVVPFYQLFWGRFGSPTKIDYRKKGTLILTSLLVDLVVLQQVHWFGH